jgi:hypothetical protein
MTTKCKGILGLIFGHKIVSCFDEKSEPVSVNLNRRWDDDSWDVSRMISASSKTESKFATAFCKRCGQKINP